MTIQIKNIFKNILTYNYQNPIFKKAQSDLSHILKSDLSHKQCIFHAEKSLKTIPLCKYSNKNCYFIEHKNTYSDISKEYYDIIKNDFQGKYHKIFSWEYLFEIGLSLSLARQRIKSKYYQKIRLYFSSIDLSSEKEFFKYMSERDFSDQIIYELNRRINNIKDINAHDKFVEYFLNLISYKNYQIEYWTKKGYSLEYSKKQLKLFFRKGAEKTKQNCLGNYKYYEWFKETQKPAAIASHTIQNNLKSSKIERELKDRIKKKFEIIDFYSPCVSEELRQLHHRRNFLHDIVFKYQDDIIIIKYNGVYWHKDCFSDSRFSLEEYMFEIKKAYNCINLVKRKHKVKYILLWENDIKDINLLENFIYDVINSPNEFISSRKKDYELYDDYIIELEKQKSTQTLMKKILNEYKNISHCLSKQVACMAVKDGRILLTGINGTIEGLTNCDTFFLEMYKEKYKEKYNSFEEWVKTDEWRNIHHSWSNVNEVHAEQSLLIKANQENIDLKNCDIYCTLQPCIHCSKILASLKPKHIFYIERYDKSESESMQLLNNNGIVLKQI